ncbi:right-handed parallel beta-helix repeat-containing protein [Thalassoroseus pseudoceratinae]|uniref:right-handed parallel beta-helix repeat-containing protein n=1 Tax=Thalassoroseus pseudoceratinae TaxID=2713176 RepID=UPI00141E09F7|nr:right-handed parallel beta-helix repeat-containing protein [Thalassoroseus pseudoceratinae]
MSSIRDFGAVGDGNADDTEAIQHALQAGDGVLEFPPGIYTISRSIEVPLAKQGSLGIVGVGGTAKVRMTGPGPAFRIVGTHGGTGDPKSVKPEITRSQRTPTISGIEIEGAHEEADGIQLIGTFQPIIDGVLIQGVRHGIHLYRRNRNVRISGCNIYHNTGVGIYLDQLNLHQINIVGNHISYNRLGGIRIEKSEIRNLQITGNDIEYNNHRVFNTAPEPTAEIYVDTTAEGASVAEVTVCSNTIQATNSEGGCNIRILGDPEQKHRPGIWAISGNIIGSQENNVHITGGHGISLSGNVIYSATNRNLLVEQSQQIQSTGNTFRRHTPSYGMGVRFVDSTDCVLSGCNLRDESDTGQVSGASLLELVRCQRIDVNGCQLLDGVPLGVDAVDCQQISILNCTIADTRAEVLSNHAVRFRGEGRNNRISGCRVHSREQEIVADKQAGLTTGDNWTEQ